MKKLFLIIILALFFNVNGQQTTDNGSELSAISNQQSVNTGIIPTPQYAEICYFNNSTNNFVIDESCLLVDIGENEEISKMGIRYFNLWKNVDGSAVSPITTKSWAREKRVQKMTSDQYRSFFEETCKEKGVYILTLAWAAGGGHATILQRDDDGLHFIEPQVYQQEYTSDGRRSIDDLLSRKLHEDPLSYSAILRVDDKLFDEKYADLFELLTETNHENT